MKKRLLALLLCVSLCLCCAAFADNVSLVPNTGKYAKDYPYTAESTSAVLYLSKDLVDDWLDPVNECLPQWLEDLELDFADARNVLSGYLEETIPRINIFIHFGKTDESDDVPAAEFVFRGNFTYGIYLNENLESAKKSLLHEYVHYLTIMCSKVRAQYYFWREGIADYVSYFLCRNRMARSVRMLLSEKALVSNNGLVQDPRDGTVDPRRLYLVDAELLKDGTMDGKLYSTVNRLVRERTQEFRENPNPELLSYYEACCMVAYLSETYGQDKVFSSWNTDPRKMEKVFGKSFTELHGEWSRWNLQQCYLLQHPEELTEKDPAASLD